VNLKEGDDMKKIMIPILLFGFVIFLTSCGGGTFANLIPLPKILKGDVTNDIYTSPDKKFQIQIPHPTKKSSTDSYEWGYTKIEEGKDGGLTFVIFGPAALDLNRYHAVVFKRVKKTDLSFNEQADSAIGSYVQRAELHTKRKFPNLRSENLTINGVYSVYKVYGTGDLFLVFSYMDYKTHVALIMAEVKTSSGIKSAAPTEKDLIERKWDLYTSFEGSLKINFD
jgi:hypothetical protein